MYSIYGNKKLCQKTTDLLNTEEIKTKKKDDGLFSLIALFYISYGLIVLLFASLNDYLGVA